MMGRRREGESRGREEARMLHRHEKCLQVFVQLGAPIPGAKYAVCNFTEYHWLVINDLCGAQLSSKQQWT